MNGLQGAVEDPEDRIVTLPVIGRLRRRDEGVVFAVGGAVLLQRLGRLRHLDACSDLLTPQELHLIRI